MRNTYKKPKPFFIVYAEGGNTPTVKHETLEAAEKEADRLSNKLGVSCYVLQAHEEYEPYEPMKPIEVEECKPNIYWFEWKLNQKVAESEALLQRLRDKINLPFIDEPGKDVYRDKCIVYNYNDSIMWVDGCTMLAQQIKMFGTELRIKE